MRQVLGPGALGKPRGSGRRGRWEGGSGWGTHVNPWLFHFNVWQNPLQIKKKKKASIFQHWAFFTVHLSHPYMTTGETIGLTRWTFVGKVMSLLFNMLSRLVIKKLYMEINITKWQTSFSVWIFIELLTSYPSLFDLELEAERDGNFQSFNSLLMHFLV